ncbi:hypothetical protein BpHYR1_028053 [Brachionus plicatilis]|uniref:Uncharacterized protein n=1 Tax=Brachionus plicatilis TaxID=10195 RepID=A0A3M7SBG9_BRAPC|nr:hypothetical protein BpHYR1_028053 [Brachionus plicatilis]
MQCRICSRPLSYFSASEEMRLEVTLFAMIAFSDLQSNFVRIWIHSSNGWGLCYASKTNPKILHGTRWCQQF